MNYYFYMITLDFKSFLPPPSCKPWWFIIPTYTGKAGLVVWRLPKNYGWTMTVRFGSAFHKLAIEKRLSMELVEKHIFELKMLFDYFDIFYLLVYFTFQALSRYMFGKKNRQTLFKIANMDEHFLGYHFFGYSCESRSSGRGQNKIA